MPPKLGKRHFLILIGGAVLLLSLLLLTRPRSEAELRPPVTPRVVLERAEPGDMAPRVVLSGRLTPLRRARLHFEVAGRVAERRVEPGMAVVVGDELLRLDDGDYRDAAALARAALEQERSAKRRDERLLALARENVAIQQREVGRLKRLGSESLSSRSQLGVAEQQLIATQSELARLEYALESADARLRQREAELSRAERNLERSRLSAPFAGRVNSVALEVGDSVSLNQAALELVDLSSLMLDLEVPGDVAAALALGQAVELEAAGSRYHGVLVALQADPEPRTHTHPLRIRIDEGGEALSPGMLARAELPLRPLSGVLSVPVAAVLREEGRAWLFIHKDGVLERRAVELGLRQAGRVVVSSGLNAGEAVVARDVAALADAQRVRVAE